MKNKLLALAVIILSGCTTIKYYEPINAQVGYKKISTVTWEVVENIDQYCKVTQKVSFEPGGFLLACTAWKDNMCNIYTDRTPSYELLGHELRHCYDNYWHN